MELYQAIKPTYTFWKYTGIITFGCKQEKGIGTFKHNTVIPSFILLSVLLFAMVNFYFMSHRFNVNSLEILYCTYFITISLGILVNILVMRYYNRQIISCFAELTAIDEKLKKLGCSIYYIQIKRDSLKMLLVYSVTFFVIIIVDLHFVSQVQVPLGRSLHIAFYYMFFVINASVSLLIFFFLAELLRRFRVINNWFFNVRKRHVSESGHFLKMHRQLRNVMKEVNVVFQGMVLGKVFSTSTTTLYNLFVYFTQWGRINLNQQRGAILSGAWCLGHILEMIGLVHYFCSAKFEVRFL